MKQVVRGHRFVFDEDSYARFATSNQARQPAMDVALKIATEIAADPTTPRESEAQAAARGRTSGQYSRSFDVRPGPGVLIFGQLAGKEWEHSYAQVFSDDRAAAPLEFGNQITTERHVLRNAGARHTHRRRKGAKR